MNKKIFSFCLIGLLLSCDKQVMLYTKNNTTNGIVVKIPHTQDQDVFGTFHIDSNMTIRNQVTLPGGIYFMGGLPRLGIEVVHPTNYAIVTNISTNFSTNTNGGSNTNILISVKTNQIYYSSEAHLNFEDVSDKSVRYADIWSTNTTNISGFIYNIYRIDIH